MRRHSDEAFWITHEGIEPRHSDGEGAERPMLAMALHGMGWIDVEIRSETVALKLNPAVVQPVVLDHAEVALRARAPAFRVWVYFDNGDRQEPAVCFLDPIAALELVRERTSTDRHDPAGTVLDHLLTGQPPPHAGDLVPGLVTPVSMPQASGPQDPVPMGDVERSLLDARQFAERLRYAEWIDDTGRHRRRLNHDLPHDEADMVLFALHSLGWAAIERNWIMGGSGLETITPDRVLVDPHGLEAGALDRLLALCEPWGTSGVVIVLSWWDGLCWQHESGTGEQLSTRLRHLVDAKQSPQFPSTVQSIAMEPDAFRRQNRLSKDHPFVSALKIWAAHGGRLGKDNDLLQHMEQAGIFERRTKLLEPDENSEFRIAHYGDGGYRIWTTDEQKRMLGGRILDVPDRRLGERVQSDVLSVLRKDDPLVHKCQGVVRGEEGPIRVSWSRLTLPVRQPHRHNPVSLFTLVLVNDSEAMPDAD